MKVKIVKIGQQNKTLKDTQNLTALFQSFVNTEIEFDKALSFHLEEKKTIKGFSFYQHDNQN